MIQDIFDLLITFLFIQFIMSKYQVNDISVIP